MKAKETGLGFLENSDEPIWDAAIILTKGEPDTVQEQDDLEAAAEVIQEEFRRHFGTELTDSIALIKAARAVLQLALDQGIRPLNKQNTMVKIRRRLASKKPNKNGEGYPDSPVIENSSKKLRGYPGGQ